MIANAITTHDRGVRVRYITCESTATTALDNLNENILLERPEETALCTTNLLL